MKTALRHLPTAARLLVGLAFVVFGLNYFLHFLPMSGPPPSDRGMAFLGGLGASGYLFPLIKSIEIAAGALLLANLFVPLALTLLAPILVNIIAFHTLLAPPNPIVFALLAGELYLAWTYRAAFRPLLAARTLPADAAPEGLGLHFPPRTTVSK
jgi:uncharacterized membrane protein YphA (DoxX/SURF4 family)